jgi:glycosyltransferase involved in cell wall biosynthesis
MTDFAGRAAVQQRVLPSYRAPFFDLLAQSCRGGLDLFAGPPRPDEAIATTTDLRVARLTPARNLHLLGGPFYLCHQRGLLEWLEASQPDALVLEANPRYIASHSAVGWMRKRGRPVLGWGLGSPPPSGWLSSVHRKARLAFLRRFDALIAYSASGADQYAGLGYARGQIFIAPNAVAPAPRNPLPQRPEQRDERPLVLAVGRLQARKRLDLLVRACAALPRELQPRLRLIGDGPEGLSLERLARDIYPATEFGGARYGAELAAHFTAADLFVLPGTGGLAIQEAMSYGLPVIVGQGDGTQGDLVRPSNGWQIPPDDFEALRQALRTALEDIPRLRTMGAESFRIVREEINLEKMVAGFVTALSAVT